MTIAEFDHLETGKKRELLKQCCGSSAWVEKMLSTPPAEDLIDLFEDAEEAWYQCSEQDWKEAFDHHPKIGDMNSLKEKFASTATWAEGEQASVKQASDQTLHDLAEGNKKYEQKFGYIFIVSASGKSAEEMLDILSSRLENDPKDEIKIAADEQNKITRIRLEKLFTQ